MNAGGVGVSAAPAGAHEAGARPGVEIALEGGRRRGRCANQLRLRTMIATFVCLKKKSLFCKKCFGKIVFIINGIFRSIYTVSSTIMAY